MAEIVIVRHGQANSHATDEISYDKLSGLGHQQARWLGEHLRETNPHFDQVITGTLSRQQDTARGMGYDITSIDPRLNELNYFDLSRALEQEHGFPAPQTPLEFSRHLPEVIDHWTRDALSGAPEAFSDFSSRVVEVIEETCTQHGRILIVTSGGVIGMVLRHVLGLQNGSMANVMLQILNSSVHRLEYVHDRLMMAGFNATPHLDHPNRAHARTFV